MTNKSDDQIYKDFGIRLKQLRRSNNITQKELAEDMDVSQTAIAQYESGTRKLPLSVLKKFAQYFDLTLDQLIYSEIVTHKDDSLENAFATNVKKQRINKKMTSVELASELNISTSELEKIESGNSSIPVSIAKKIIEYFELSMDQLVGINLENERKHIVLTQDKVLTERYKKWQSVIGYGHFTDEEIDELMNHAKYIIWKRDNT